MFHISIGERGLLYSEVCDHAEFKALNSFSSRVEFREMCGDKNLPVLVEVVGGYPLRGVGLAEEILMVYPVGAYTGLWSVPASFLKPLLPKE